MGFAGLSDDAEGPGAVSTYKASSVEPIIGKRFVRCKKFFLTCSPPCGINFQQAKFFLYQQVKSFFSAVLRAPPHPFQATQACSAMDADVLSTYFDAKQHGTGKKKPEALRLRANPPKEEGGGDTGRWALRGNPTMPRGPRPCRHTKRHPLG